MCSGEQIGVVFLLIKNNCPEALEYDEEGSINVRTEKLDDNLVKRLNNLLEMWGVILKPVVTGKRK